MEQAIAVAEPSLLIGARTEAILRSIARTSMAHAPEVATRLLGEIERADIVDEADLPADVVTLGSFVTYRVLASGSINTVQLVCPHESDPGLMRISVASAIGTALIGLKPSHRIAWEFGGRSHILEVIRVSRLP